MSKKGKLEHISIDTADNGYSIHHRHAMPAKTGGSGDAPMPTSASDSPKPHLAKTRDEVHAHIDQLLAEHEGGADDGSHTGTTAATEEFPPDHPVRKLSRRKP
jgi:hypothetical protein